MSIIYFSFIVLSSFLHAFYNFLMRKKDGDQFYLTAVFIVATLISFPVILGTGGYKNIQWDKIPYIYGASLFYVLYQVFVNISYRKGGNISTNYPLSVLSPLFIPIWAFFLLGEKISVLTAAGIVITVLGAIAIQLKGFSMGEILNVFRFKMDSAGARFAIAASFVYSFGAIFDKYVVSAFPLTTYLFFIIGFMSLNMMVYMIISRKSEVIRYARENRRIVLIGGTGLFFSFLFFRLALQKVAVSVAVPIRQFSIIFAVLLGVIVLKEELRAGKFAAITIIIAGILLVNLGL